MTSVSGLALMRRIEARDRTVRAAMLALNHSPQVHYTQGPNRWEGINKKLHSQEGKYPHFCDCSSFATWCLWNGLFVKFGVRDVVNNQKWQAGYTGTMLDNGKQVVHMNNVQRGDLVIYGDGPPGHHVAIVVGRRSMDNQIMVVSHGSEPAPLYLPYNYRSDVMCVRRYI